MPQTSLRLAYAVEFLIALMVVLFVWSDIGGPDLPDLIPWYWRFVLSIALAAGIVLATAAAVDEPKCWNPRFLRWLLVVVGLIVTIGAVSYHYRMLAPAETDEDTMEDSSAGVTRPDGQAAEERRAA